MGIFEDFVERSQNARTEAQLRATFASAMAAEGFENYILSSVTRKDASNTIWVEVVNGYFDVYRSKRRELVDPILQHCVSTSLPFLWNEVAKTRQFLPEQNRFLQEVESFGVHSVVWLPVHSRAGRRDGIGLSRRHPDPPDPARLPILHAISAQTWSRYLELTDNHPPLPPDGASLTAKELEVLNWMKDGKGNADIADIMTLSVKTIEYHVTNILRKLGASNRIGAVVIAIRHSIVAI